MATTTTQITAATTRLRSRGYPADYDVHHSDASSSDKPLSSHQETVAPNHTTTNPPNWPDYYRRVPSYRPTNRTQDQTERRAATSVGERLFLINMFTGLETNVMLNRVWQATGGRISKDVFKYKVGGEF